MDNDFPFQEIEEKILRGVRTFFPDGELDTKHNAYTFITPPGAKLQISLTTGNWFNVSIPGVSGDNAISLFKAVHGIEKDAAVARKINNWGKSVKDLFNGQTIYKNKYFVCLGYDHGTYYFLSKVEGQILAVQYCGLSQSVVRWLAPFEFWYSIRLASQPKNQDMKFLNNKIFDFLIKMCQKEGVFDRKKIRGRGAYLDKGNLIINTGKHIIDKNEKINIEECESEYHYIKGVEIKLDIADQLSDKKGKEIFDLIKKISYSKSGMAYYLAGWAVVAFISGALNWRPHVFLTGSSGSGKSTVIDMIVKKFMGDYTILTYGNSSEASIRAAAQEGAIPIIIDEGEKSKSKNSTSNMEALIELARLSSKELDGDGVLRASANGGGPTCYHMRSCWLISGVIPSIESAADITRFSMIELQQKYTGDDWVAFKGEIKKTIDEKVSSAIKSRILWNYEILFKNIEIFSDACGVCFKNSRIGDQIGTLLAGAAFLETKKIFTLKEAQEYIKKSNVMATINMHIDETDEQECFNLLIQHRILVNIDGHSNKVYTIHELINWFIHADPEGDFKKEIQRVLDQYGIRVKDTFLYIKTKCRPLEDAFKGTVFNKYARVLKRHERFRGIKTNYRFGGTSRGDALILEFVDQINDNYNNEPDEE